ncbi:poly-beta-hydroxybutyrate-responsive repressor [Effusibacillus consociatus]|uniref:Poly-beta-hydroxybutyrate-responsive repressor n=1 Tax=Effusibacillus consociatus TaxID=1117041 RepID=A0ABV9Q3K0_9BACL
MTEEKESIGFGGPPKNFLVPFVLLLLQRMPIHGYELMQKLTEMGFQALDQGNLYRMLRQLEKDKYVRSEWDTSSSGPAKRLYSLTDIGEAYLQTYAQELERYQKMLGQFFSMYTNMLNLYMPSYRAEGDKEKSNKSNQRRNSNESEGEE